MIYPPRPEKAVPKEDLARYERLGWLAQIKMNGTCSVFETTEHFPVCYTRHQEPHKLWRPENSKVMPYLMDLDPGTTLVGEVLHSKVTDGPKDTLYLFDVLTYKGKDLYGEHLKNRLALLRDLFKVADTLKFYERVTDHLWLTRSFYSDFLETFDSLDRPEFEGLVLKDPESRLKSCQRKSDNSGWQIKCRKAHATYSF